MHRLEDDTAHLGGEVALELCEVVPDDAGTPRNGWKGSKLAGSAAANDISAAEFRRALGDAVATPALVLAHQLERCLVGLGAGVLEQDLTRAGVDQPIEGFGDGRLMLVGEQVRRVGERVRLSATASVIAGWA